MIYKVKTTQNAESELEILKRSNPKAYKKAGDMIVELIYHPRSGTGHPEPLRNCLRETWSRRITKKDRLVYVIEDQVVTVTIVSALGHYDDK